MPPPARSIAEVLAQEMATYVGPHTARVAVKTFSLKALGRGPETLTTADVPALTQALRPMLRTLAGRLMSDAIVEQIHKVLEIGT